MKKRMILLLIVVALLVGGLGTVKFLQIRAAMASGNYQPPPEAVTTAVANAESWPAELNTIGTAEAIQGVVVSADMPGIVKSIEFESGKNVQKGAVLVRLDTKQEEAQLNAAESQRDLAKLNLERYTGLKSQGVVALSDYDRTAAEARQADARVNEIRASIARKTIRAPFSGFLGLRQVNLGQYLESGAPIVPLQMIDPIYVTFAVPQQEASGLRPGIDVKISTQGLETSGKITAVDSVVDQATRNIRAQATVANADGKLRPGMFVKAQVALGQSAEVVSLPASAISYAAYGDSVFVVSELKDPKGKSYRGVTQHFVKLGPGRGDQVAILSGVKPGSEVVTSGVFKLRNGAAVLVDNSVLPANSAAPKPENS